MKIVYYSDPLNEEFSETQIQARKIDGGYDYLPRGAWKRFTRFFWYRIVATPFAWLFLKLKFRHRIVGRDALRQLQKGAGCFLFGNHTQEVADAFIPTFVGFPRRASVIVHPNNVSMPVLGHITPSLGALPLPDDMDASRNFLQAVETRLGEGNAVCIYPEAHIWPYCTFIRPFSDKSFRYPVKYGAASYCFTNTYQAKKPNGRVRIVTYVDGPFYPDPTLPIPQRRKALRDQIYGAMTERAKCSNVERVRYVPREEKS